MRNPRTRRRAGLTMIELLVAVAILAVMILAFGMIVAESRRVVTTSEALMRANASAQALSQAIRDDLRRVTQNGMLCIAALPDGRTLLFLTSAGPVTSLTDASAGAVTYTLTANGTVTAYGLCANTGPLGGNVLWRAAWLLRYDSAAASADKDYWGGWDLINVQVLDRTSLNTGVIQFLIGDARYVPAAMAAPPTDLAGIANNWKCLALNCSELSVSWTDGTQSGGELVWYRKDNAKDSTWGGKIASSDGIEFAEGGAYRAMWTHDNPAAWPLAVRVQFRVQDPSMPEEMRKTGGLPYEVICPVAR